MGAQTIPHCCRCRTLLTDENWPKSARYPRPKHRVWRVCYSCLRKHWRTMRSKHKDSQNAWRRQYRKLHPEQHREQERRRYWTRYRELFRQKRYQVLIHYSNGTPKCACCEESEIRFLTLDHIEGGGNRQRKSIGTGITYWLWLIKNNYPKGYQTLCMNCNWARYTNGGICPHKDTVPLSIGSAKYPNTDVDSHQ